MAQIAALVLVALLVSITPLGAQVGSCGLGNARLWCAHQDLAAVAGAAQPNDNFGAAVALGDFDGDGDLDLAVGSPGEADGAANNAGLIHVFYFAGVQLLGTGSQVFDQDSITLDDDDGTESGDRYGAALAAGDFNGDGFDDLAVGSPGEDMPTTFNHCGIDNNCQQGGVVHVYRGSPTGLTTVGAQFLSKDDVPGTAYVDNSAFGSVLAAVDNDADQVLELIVGMPGEGASVTGKVWIYRFDGFDLQQTGQIVLDQDNGGNRHPSAADGAAFGLGPADRTVTGCAFCDFGATDAGLVHVSNVGEVVQTDFGAAGASTNDNFGASIAVGDFDGDGEPDLAIGAPNKNHGTGNPDNSGRVYIAFGPLEDGVQNHFAILGGDSVPGQTAAADEFFGTALAAGDFDGDGFDDLLVGAPGEFAGDDGAFLTFFGGITGLTGQSRFNEGSLGGTATDGHEFGSVLAAGDLDGDGIDEVIVGVPQAGVAGDAGAGIVYVSRALDPRLIFLDGFDEDGTASWSAIAP